MPDKKSLNVRVREGFVVTYEEKVKQGDKIVTREQQYYPEDGVVMLDSDRVLQHAHKLEPADDDAGAFLQELHIRFDPPAGPPGVDTGAIAAQAAAAAVKATLSALGIDGATLADAAAAKASKASAKTA